MTEFVTNLHRLSQRLGDVRKLLDEAKSAFPAASFDRIEDSISAWHNFVSAPAMEWLIDADSRSIHGAPSIVTSRRLEEVLGTLNKIANSLGGSSSELASHCDELDDLLARTADQYRGEVLSLPLSEDQKREVSKFLSHTYTSITNRRMIEQAQRAQRALSTVESAASEATKAKANLQQASGEAAESRLAREYGAYAETEATTADRFRIATIVLIAVGVTVGYLLPHDQNWSVADAVYRIALLAGIFGLAGYLGRQSFHHRELAAWANSIRVQLLTFEAFLDPFSNDEIRDQVRVLFAGRVFGPSPQSKGEPATLPSADLLDRITDVVARTASTK